MKAAIVEPAPVKQMVKIISNLMDDAKFTADKDGMEISGTNGSKIAYIRLSINPSICVEYESKDVTELGLNIATLNKAMATVEPNDIIHLKSGTDSLHVKFAGRFNSKYMLRAIEEAPDESHMTDKPQFKIIMSPDDFEKIIKKTAALSEQITFEVNRNQFHIKSTDDINECDIPIPEGDYADYEFTKPSGKAMYSAEILKIVIVASKVFENLSVQFADDGCLKLLYNIPEKMTFELVLAPRIA